jgi:hypothetical protein
MHPSIFVKMLEAVGAPFRPTKAPSGHSVDAHRYAELFASVLSSSRSRHKWAGAVDGGKDHVRPSEFENHLLAPRTAVSIRGKDLQSMFGSGGFDRINGKLGLIESGDKFLPSYMGEKGITKPYWISETGLMFLETCRVSALELAPGPLYDRNGRKFKRRDRKGPFQSRDKNGNNAKTKSSMFPGFRWAVPVNMEIIYSALNEWVLKGLFPDMDEARRISMESQLRLLHLCAYNDNIGEGLLPQIYQESPSGRMNVTGAISLQTIHREARGIVLCGFHEYDFHNCFYRVLYQKAGIKNEAVENYIQRRDDVRQGLADRYGVSKGAAKIALLSMLFGATARKGGALVDILGSQKIADALANDPEWKSLRIGAGKCRRAMIKRARFIGSYGSKIKNIRGKTLGGRSNQLLYHLLEGWESYLLQIVLREYQDHMILLHHDGWVLDTYVDPADIEELICKHTGLEMPIEHKQLKS